MGFREKNKKCPASLKILLTAAVTCLLSGMILWEYGEAVSFAYIMAPDSPTTAYVMESASNHTEEAAESPAVIYETVVKSTGGTACISRSLQPGEGNRYVCYFEEDEEEISLLFRIQRQGALPEEKALVVLEWRTVDKTGTHQTKTLPEEAYRLPPDIRLIEFPVVLSPEQEEDGYIDPGLSQDEGIWYELSLLFTSEGLTAMAADGKTLIISVFLGSGTDLQAPPVIEHAVHAEIRLVMRNQFDLD